MKKQSQHDVKIQNDYGTVTWTEKHEEAFRLLNEGAWTLQMTLSEFVEMLSESDRQCPKCRDGVH